eukprot:899788-Rhodomonas_salina.1
MKGRGVKYREAWAACGYSNSNSERISASGSVCGPRIMLEPTPVESCTPCPRSACHSLVVRAAGEWRSMLCQRHSWKGKPKKAMKQLNSLD